MKKEINERIRQIQTVLSQTEPYEFERYEANDYEEYNTERASINFERNGVVETYEISVTKRKK